MAWSPATQMLAFSVGAHDSTVKLIQFDGSGFGTLRNFPMFDGIPADLEFSSDGRYLAAAGDSSGVSIREVATGQEAGVLPTGGYVNELDLFGDRKLMVSGAEIVFWSFRTEQEAELLENPDLNSQVTSQVITRIVGGIAGGVAIAYLLPIFILGHGDPVSPMVHAFRENPVKTAPDSWCGRSTTITPDGRLLADIYPGITREVIRVIDLRSGELVKSLDPRGENSCAARFSPDGSSLLVTTDKEARLYSTATWRYRDLDLH
jgi:WD40 repeat protein